MDIVLSVAEFTILCTLYSLYRHYKSYSWHNIFYLFFNIYLFIFVYLEICPHFIPTDPMHAVNHTRVHNHVLKALGNFETIWRLRYYNNNILYISFSAHVATICFAVFIISLFIVNNNTSPSIHLHIPYDHNENGPWKCGIYMDGCAWPGRDLYWYLLYILYIIHRCYDRMSTRYYMLYID